MKTKLYFVLALALTLAACNSDDNDNNNVPAQNIQVQHAVIGNWIWMESTGGIGGMHYTPESTGEEILLKISETTVEKYVNGELTQTRPYTLETHPSIQGGKKEMLVFEGSGINRQSYDRDEDNLKIFDECFDCFQSEYIRE